MSARKTVVVVDDEPGICEALRDLLEDEGYEVCIANDGGKALTLLHAMPTKPCIVFLDLLMPVLDGGGVYKAMKADPVLASVPVVITTSDPSRAPSGVLIMKKPVAFEVLLDTVRKCC